MTPKDIFDGFREEAHDPGTVEAEFLWKTPFLRRALNEARMQAARRAHLLEEADEPAICSIQCKVDKMTYDVDRRVIRILRVKHSLIDMPLPKSAVRDLDAFQPGWESQTSEQPVTWAPWGNYKLRLLPPPNATFAAGKLQLMVIREPLADLTEADDDNESAMDLPGRTHYALKDFMMFRAYMQRDLLEKYRPEEAKDRLDMFTSEFGPPVSSLDEVWIQRKHGYDDYEGNL